MLYVYVDDNLLSILPSVVKVEITRCHIHVFSSLEYVGIYAHYDMPNVKFILRG